MISSAHPDEVDSGLVHWERIPFTAPAHLTVNENTARAAHTYGIQNTVD